MKACDWCNKHFEPAVSYQIYCSIECREQATKEKIAERHKYLKIQNRKNKVRICVGGCGQTLSIYNEDNICSTCSVNIKEVNLRIKEIKRLMNEAESEGDQ